MSTQGQGHSLTFVQGHSDFINFKHFFLNHKGAIEAIFHMEPSAAVHGKGMGR